MSNSSALVKIGQAAKILGVSIDTLRRWEKAGRLSPVYTPGGTRLYSVAQIKGLKKPTHQTSVDSSQYSVDKHQAPNSLNTERSEGPVLRSEYPSHLTPPTQLPYLAQSNTVLEVDQYEPLDLSRLTPPAEVKQIAIPQLIIMSGVSASLLGLTVGAFFLGSAMLFPNQTKGVAGQLASSALNLLAPQMYAELSVAEVVEPAEPVRNWTLASQGQALQGEGQVLAANDVAHFLEINSSTTIGGDLTTEASAFVGLDLDVSGASTLGDTLTVSGATVLEDTLEVSGQTTLTDLIASGQVQVTGNAADTLLIQPSSDPDTTTKLFTLKNAAGAEKFSLTANGDLALTGTSTLGGTLTVSGASTLQSVTATTLTTSGLATLASLKVTGVSTLTGAVAAESTLKVTGATTLSSSLEVSGATTLGSTLAVTGAATFASTINTNTLTATALTFSGSTPKISSANSQIALIGGVGVGYTGATSPAFPSLGLAVLGNVGIGTTSPSAKLEVIGNASVTGSLTIGSGSILQLADGTYSSPSLTFTSDTDTGLYRTGTNSLSLVTAGSASQTLTLDSSGNVGIGTTSPNAKFSVIGNALIGADYNGYSPPTNGLLVQGNTGIGTSAPQGVIDVNGASYFRNTLSLTSGQLLINNGSASLPAHSFLNSPTSGLYSPSLNALSLITNGSATSGLTIAPSGFVGVGTTSPGARLAVNGGAVVGADYSSLTSPTNGLFVQGNVGIGTTASLSTLAINGGVTIGADYTKNYTAQPNNMLVQGNVGIGTTTGLGTYALSISGNAGIGGHILPIGASRDVGSSGNRWNVGYFNEVNATTIAGTVTGGSTSAADWTINSDNTSNDTETMSLTFNRGESSPGVSVTPDAVFRWDVGDKQFNLNSGLLIGSTPMDSQITDNKYGLEFSSIPFDITTSGSEHLALVPGGNVGIGTSGPGQKLAVVDASSNYIASFTKGTGNVPLYIYSDTAGSGIAPAASIRNLIYQVPGDRIAFYGNSAEVMRVTDGGNVGIGTASPTSRFQVTGGNVGIGVTSAVSTLAVNGNSTIGWGLAGVSGPASGLAVSGNVGVGTTSPLANLHVVGQCVAEGTRIRRRRKNNKGEWVEEEVPVEDIKPGDEVLSLDDVTGEFEWNKVEKTLNKGVQETLALTTASNKRILTTKAHPYLVLDRPLITQGIFEVDQSIRVEDLGRSTVVGIALGKLMFTAALHQSTKKDLLKYYQKLNKPHLFGPQIFGQALLETFKAANIYPARIIIDTEYTGYENVIRDIVKKGLPDSEIDFQPIGRKSAAHEAAIQVHLKKKEADIRLEGTGETEKDPGHKALRAVSSRTDYRKSHRPQGQILGISYYTERDLSRSKWTKTSQIKAGQYIATVDGWEKVTGIQEIKRLQTYDLQIANTHNFIGNGIVAHNTYITGNLGVGVNPATKFHILGSGTGTGVNLLTQGSTQTNFGLAVLDSGNVGIGTTSPVGKLDVRAGTLTLSNTSNLSSNIDWYNLSSDSVAGRIGYSFSGASPADTLSFLTAGSLKMSLNSSGNVGIYSGTTATAVQRFQVNTTTSNPFVVTSSGNVGIGFSSPSTMLYVGSNGIPDVAGSGDVYFQNDLEVDGVLNVAGAATFGGSFTPSGQILASDGTAALPGYSFSSDPDSGLWRSTSNFIHLTTGGTNTQGLAINASGNVGIGTSAPREKFTIYDAGGIGNAFENRTDTTVDKTVTIYTDTSSQILAFGNQTDFRIGSSSLTQSLSAGGFSEAMRITSGGNVGIGTASPSVAGLSIDSNSNSNALRLFGATEASQIADLYVGSTGNLIVSTVAGSSSAGYLDLRSEDDQYGVLIQDSSGATVDSAYANFYMKDASTDYLQILVNAAQTPAGTGLVIQSGGNVGIGTTSPEKRFHVYESSATTGTETGMTIEQASTGDAQLQFLLTGTKRWSLGIDNSDSDKFKLSDGNSVDSNTRLTIQTDGNVGIGTASPLSLLNVNSTTDNGNPILTISGGTGSGTNVSQLSFYSNSGSATIAALQAVRNGGNDRGDLLFLTSAAGTAAEKMRITKDGNVGIGTTGPLSPLQVSSSVTASGGIAAGVRLTPTLTAAANSDELSVLATSYSGSAPVIAKGAFTGLTVYGINADPANITSTGAGTVTNSYGVWTRAHASLATNNYALYSHSGTNVLNATSGNTGIGTASPAHKLQVAAPTGAGDTRIRLSVGSNALDLINTETANYLSAEGAVPLHLRTSATERLTILSGGNVGIGTASPGAPLHVSSGDSIFGAGSGAAGVSLGSGTITQAQSSTLNVQGFGASNSWIGFNQYYDDAWKSVSTNAFQIYHTGTNLTIYGDTGLTANTAYTPTARVTIQGGGNVGIGTASPGTLLHLASATPHLTISSTGANHQYVDFADSVSTTRWQLGSDDNFGSSGFFIYDNGNSKYAFGINSATGNLLLQPTSGNVGIGTASPLNKLHVYDGKIASSSNADNNDFIRMYMAPTNNNVGILEAMWDNSSALPATIGINPFGGNVGIGTTGPGEKLHIVHSTDPTIRLDDGSSRTVEFRSGSSAQNPWIGTTYNATFLLGANSSETQLALATGGNVGIGTASPRVKLDLRSDAVIAAPTALSSAVASGVFTIGDTVGSVFGLQLNGASYDTYIQARNMGAASTAYNLLLQPLGGNVGIGTSVPQSRINPTSNPVLNIHSVAGAGVAGLTLTDANTTQESFIGTDGTGMFIDVAGHATGTSNFIQFRGTNTASSYSVSNLMRIQGDGNVGIGTASPLQLLTVGTTTSNAVHLGQGDPATGTWIRNDGSNTVISTNVGSMHFGWGGNIDKSLKFMTGGGTAEMILLDGGNLGLGTESPVADFHLVGDAASTAVNFMTQASTGAFGLAVLDNGNVGIGTTGPNNRLEVRSTTTPQLRVAYDGTNYFTLSAASDGVTTLTSAANDIQFGNRIGVSSSNDHIYRIGTTNHLEIGGGGHTGSSNPAKIHLYAGDHASLPSRMVVYSSNADDTALVSRFVVDGRATTANVWFENSNVGIGTSVPTSTLAISNSATGSDQQTVLGSNAIQIFYPSYTNGRYYPGIVWSSNSTPGPNLGIWGQMTNSGSRMFFGTSSNNTSINNLALTIDNNGNIGFGVAAPLFPFDQRSTVSGTSVSTYLSSAGGQFAILGNGNVGIGFTSPAAKLHVSGGSILLDNANWLAAKQSSGTITNMVGMSTSNVAFLGALDGGQSIPVALATVGVERVRIDTNGNVGIGWTSPTNLLHSRGLVTGYAGAFENTRNTAAAHGLEVKVFSTATGSKALDVLGGTTSLFNVQASGNVGIGNSAPVGLLNILDGPLRAGGWNAALQLQPSGNDKYPSIIFSGQDSDNYSALIWTNDTTGNASANQMVAIYPVPAADGTSSLNFATNATPGSTALQRRMTISAAGNVGIGFSSPAAKLEVRGDSNVLNVNLINDSATTARLLAVSNNNSTWSGGNGIANFIVDHSSATGPAVVIQQDGSGLGLRVTNIGTNYAAQFTNAQDNTGAPGIGIEFSASGSAGGAAGIQFTRAGGTNIGSVTHNALGTVAYNTSSDVRLKENIQDTHFGLEDLMQIKTRDFVFKGDTSGKVVTGFIAQELYGVFPQAVTVGGEDSKMKPWSVEYGGLTPLIVKSIQDQQLQIDELKDKTYLLSVDSDGYLNVPKVKADHLVLNQGLQAPTLDSVSFAQSPGDPVTETSVDSSQYSDSYSLADMLNAIAISNEKLATSSALLANLESQQASQSAVIASVGVEVASSSAQIADLNDKLLTINDKLDLLASASASPLASSSATVTDLAVTNSLTTLTALVQDSLRVLGQTILGPTLIAGDLVIDGMNTITGNSISNLGILFIQNGPLAEAVDFFNGLVRIDSAGNVAAQSLSLKSGETVGSGTMLVGESYIDIYTPAVKGGSKILITPTNSSSVSLFVNQKIEGSHFRVALPDYAPATVTFDWVIINEQQ